MKLDALRAFCATLPGATRDIKWGDDECYCVGGKMFAVFFPVDAPARSVSFKCEPARFLELTDVPGIVPAPYLARAHWVHVKESRALTDAAARELLTTSHALVFAKLTRRERTAITAPESTR